MSDRIPISEVQIHSLKGKFPTVETYAHVNTDLLYQGDDNTFHITLPISEIGRVSDNGLAHDDELQATIISFMEQGVGGLRGHIPDGQENTAFPLDVVHWVGHKQDGGVLWAKGYIPPGTTRDDIRRKIARGGSIGTSIYGSAIKETVTQNGKKKTWRARQFELESIDLAPAKRAALRMEHGVKITKEMSEEGDMPEKNEVVSVADVPVAIREQIIRESAVAAKAERVAELEKVNGDLTTQVAELATYKSIVAEIRTTLGKDADTVQMVAQYHGMATKLAEMLNVPFTNIESRVQEMHEQVVELKKTTFNTAVDSKIAELTDWTPKTDDGKKKVAAFRANLRRAVLAEMSGEQDAEKIAETANKLWDAEFSTLAESVVAQLGGPAALVGSKPPVIPAGVAATDEQLNEWAGRYNQSRKQ